VLVIVAPGQGAQAPGFLAPWLADSEVADRLNWLGAVAGLDLAHYGTEADAETIRDTAIAQPLLVGSALVALRGLLGDQLQDRPQDRPQADAVSGHSVGELAAAAAAGVLTDEQAMVFVRERGKAMAEAAKKTPTSMTAVLGGDPDEVLAKLAEHGVVPANNNGPGQVVAAGTTEQLDALAADPPARARLVPLSVAGAFHTEHMGPAVDVLAGYARAIGTGDPRTRLISNLDGRVVADGRDMLRRLVEQVRAPVRWDLCMQTMTDLQITGILELPPAGTLTGIAKRALKGVETFALKTPDQLDDARAFVAKHASGDDSHRDDGGENAGWRLLVAPMGGTFTRGAGQTGAEVGPGETVARVRSEHDELAVTAPHGGTVAAWLVEEGDTVAPGQPLVRLQPKAGS
jgi:[acyl-carrier-protein] S-malonyltransferase